jgi:eukaryotic-like serine/threonine-protein kinase
MSESQNPPHPQPPTQAAQGPEPAERAPVAEPAPAAAPAAEANPAIFPTPGEVITSLLTNCTYAIGEPIGQGSFGIVYACVDDWNNNLAAKVLRPTKPPQEIQAAALAEMNKLVLLRHPQVTYFYDAFEYRNVCYIVTERCASSIADLMTRDWFHGPIWTLPIARSLLQAVQFLHLNEYAHQDIHAGNVFVLEARNELNPQEPTAMQFRLGDLGVAKLFSEIRPENTRAQWMLPPEVLSPSEFGPPDHRVDIYHCGLLLLQLELSKEVRFTKEEILDGRPRQMALELRAPYNFALEKALRRHVSMRTESARELWRDLNSQAEAPVQPAAAGTAAEPQALPDAPQTMG